MLSANYTLSWSDITNIYNGLNTQRQRFGLNNINVPNYEDYLAMISQMQELKNQIESLSTVNLIGSNAITNVTVPSKGSIIKPLEYSKMQETIDNIGELCVHFANFTADHSPYNASHRSSDFTTDYSPNFSSDHDNFSDFTDFGDNSPDNSHRSSDFSENSPDNSHRSNFGDFGSNRQFNFKDFDAQDASVFSGN